MAQRVEVFVVTSPAGTLQAAAVETETVFNPGNVRGVEIRIPPGHAGLTGIAIAQAHQIIVPATGADWIVGDDDLLRWDLSDFLDSGAWSAFTYNTDVANAHSWYVRYLIDEIVAPVSLAAPVPLSPAAIMAGTA